MFSKQQPLNPYFFAMKTKLIVRLLVLALAFSPAVTFTSCKSKKKIAAEQAAAQRKKDIAALKNQLTALLNNDDLTADEMQNRLNGLRDKAARLNDPSLSSLVKQVEAKIEARRKAEKEAAEAAAAEAAETEAVNQKKTMTLQEHMTHIKGAASGADADARINEALKIFASDDTPVLIIVYKKGDTVDYDEPTTARKYLERLKDVKVAPDPVFKATYNDAGKITKLKLIKKSAQK